MNNSKKTLRALILIAHGSRRVESNTEIKQLTNRLRANLSGAVYDIIDCCFLEIAEPAIETCVQSLCDLHPGVEFSIDFLPYFLSSGNHVEKDIPKKLATVCRLSQVNQCNQLDYIGKNAGLLDFLTLKIIHSAPPIN